MAWALPLVGQRALPLVVRARALLLAGRAWVLWLVVRAQALVTALLPGACQASR